MDKNFKLESVFEEGNCTTCGRSGVDKFTSILDTFIKCRNNLISFVNLIKTVLNFEPKNENCSMEICEHCKVKLQEFYIFRMRSEEVRKIYKEHFDPQSKLLELDKQFEDPIVTSTFEIVRDYIQNHSVSSINVDSDSKRLIIYSQDCEEEEIQEDPEENIEQIEEDEEIDEVDTIDEEVIEDYVYEEQSAMESIDESSSAHEKPTNKRRSKHPENWICNKRKKLRNSGQSYVNSKGKLVNERKMLPSCGPTCRSKCDTRVTEEDRAMNFSSFWQLGDVVEQRKFIHEHITSREPSRRKVANSNRTLTLQFYLDVKNSDNSISLTNVCKKMFKNTLVVSSQLIQGVVRKYSQTGFVDSRGKHKRKLTEAQHLARAHVEQFPFFYIDRNMTKIQLYHMYCSDCNKKGIEPVKESNYRDIFEKFHSNNFLKSENVLCEKCNQFFKATDEERISLEKEHDQHLANNSKCRDRAQARLRNRRWRERKQQS